MTNATRLLAAAAVAFMSSSAAFAAESNQLSYGENTVNLNDDTTINRRAVGTGDEVNVVPSDVVAMERGRTRNINYFTGRPASGQQ